MKYYGFVFFLATFLSPMLAYMGGYLIWDTIFIAIMWNLITEGVLRMWGFPLIENFPKNAAPPIGICVQIILLLVGGGIAHVCQWLTVVNHFTHWVTLTACSP